MLRAVPLPQGSKQLRSIKMRTGRAVGQNFHPPEHKSTGVKLAATPLHLGVQNVPTGLSLLTTGRFAENISDIVHVRPGGH
jgi:hypothetical protein